MLSTLLGNLPGMAYRCLHDADWTLEFVSDASFALLGYTPEQLVTQKVVAIADLIHPDDLEGVSLAVEAGLAERRPFRCEYRMRTADGSEIWVREQGVGVYSDDGDLLALEGFLMDITAQVAAERSLRETHKREALGLLAGGIAHDFNNLLTVILSSANIIERRRSSGTTQRETAAIRAAAEKASKMTAKLLSFGRASPGRIGPVDLNQVVDGLRPILTRLLPAEISLSVSPSGEPAWVRMDASRLEQILLNLVVNARDAIKAGGSIQLGLDVEAGTDPDPGFVVLRVRDDGQGMSADILANIFEPFFTTKNADQGTGLGLAVVHSAVVEVGGAIDVESTPSEGTEFTVRFPRTLRRPDLADTVALASRVILIAERDERVRGAVSRGLRDLGYSVFEAANGRQAFHISERHKGTIDVLLTVRDLPVMNGDELCSAIRETRPQTRCILLAEAPGGSKGKYDVVLIKPVELRALSGAIENVLQTASS